jgi:hypothetical protein
VVDAASSTRGRSSVSVAGMVVGGDGGAWAPGRGMEDLGLGRDG